MKFFAERAEINRVFFSSNETAGTVLIAGGDEALDVPTFIGMVIAEGEFGRGEDAGGADLRKELLRPGDTAEHDWGRRGIEEDDCSVHLPQGFFRNREGMSHGLGKRVVMGGNNRMGATQGAERFAEAA